MDLKLYEEYVRFRNSKRWQKWDVVRSAGAGKPRKIRPMETRNTNRVKSERAANAELLKGTKPVQPKPARDYFGG